MTARTFSAAYAIARPLAQKGDRAGATALLCGLLWSVEADQGGFLGLDDEALREYCGRDPRLDYQAAIAAAYAPAPWPQPNIIPFPIIAANTVCENQVASIPNGLR